MSGETSKVRTQNLRNFTVQIRRISDDAIVGTGIVVSIDGEIVTCAHVVETAGVNLQDTDGAEVCVYFPKLGSRKGESLRAKVSACFSQYDDDLVLLQLADGPAPRDTDQIAVLGSADASTGHEFRSYGYRPLDGYNAGRAEGKILGDVEPPEERKLLADPVQLKSGGLNLGMSGAAVLDVNPDSNLVVGVISEVYFSDGSTKDRDTAWAVNSRVLTFDPINLPVQDEPYPMRPASRPRIEIEAVNTPVILSPNNFQEYAPAPLEEWVGREELLKAVSKDWAGPDCRVTGLIGFGGEGKSSLARRWLDDLLKDSSQTQPDGIFWWGFYERRNTDEFFEAALEYLSGGSIDLCQLPSSNAKAHLIAAMLSKGHYVFVMDGLEVLQHEEGDSYGLLKSADLREFLSYFANPEHKSFCLITSRAPVLDLMDYTTYKHRDVGRLSPKDGRDLMLNLGVKGSDKALDNVVEDWDGHALTLSLLGSYLVEIYEGDVSHIGEIPPPTADEPRYDRVDRILRRYDEHLDEFERVFLEIASAFREPVDELAFKWVFQTKQSVIGSLTNQKRDPSVEPNDDFNASIVALNHSEFNSMIEHLVIRRILRYNPHYELYTIHPLIRAHYYARLAGGDQARKVHWRIKDYYLETYTEIPRATMEDIKPLVEAVHHSCSSGYYDEAIRILWRKLYHKAGRVLVDKLGAWKIALDLMQELFPAGDLSKDPLVNNPIVKAWILNEVGLCLMNLGYLMETAQFYERSNKIRRNTIEEAGTSGKVQQISEELYTYISDSRDILCQQNPEELYDQDIFFGVSVSYINLTELYSHIGKLNDSADAAQQSLNLVSLALEKASDISSIIWRDQCAVSLNWLAWVNHLRGYQDRSDAAFQKAESIQKQIMRPLLYLANQREIYTPNTEYLSSQYGIHHADHLRRTGNAEYARDVSEANLIICEHSRWLDDISQCHRVLGDLEADNKQYEKARRHYDEALKIAHSITRRDVLIEALLARGRWAARRGEVDAARSDLEEALDYALSGGYRIYEADIRVGLAWMHLAEGDNSKAREQAERAKSMSAQMGYHWGLVDAEEVLSAQRSRSPSQEA